MEIFVTKQKMTNNPTIESIVSKFQAFRNRLLRIFLTLRLLTNFDRDILGDIMNKQTDKSIHIVFQKLEFLKHDVYIFCLTRDLISCIVFPQQSARICSQGIFYDYGTSYTGI